MLDEAKQAFAFTPSGKMAGVNSAKSADDVAHKRTCAEIKQQHGGPGYYQLCGDVWSDNTSLYFNHEERTPRSLTTQLWYTWKGRLDRITGRLEVSSWASVKRENGKDDSGTADWALVCKKVDKLVDAK
jgi:hypothetical protein